MSIAWNDSTPIYRQLRDRVVAMILDGVLKQGDPLPSVRQVAASLGWESAQGSSARTLMSARKKVISHAGRRCSALMNAPITANAAAAQTI